MKTIVQANLFGILLPLLALTPICRAQVVAGDRSDPNRTNSSSTGKPDHGFGSEETVVMSPFEVDAAGQRGYYAPNTMAGTRLNSKLSDLASSIAVVTKEQMADFALLDINDVFLYEAGTEGTGNYTEFSFGNNGYPLDNTQLEPNQANRVRGVSSANTARGNFETSGRVPIDPIDIDAVEISRGPNANIFGLGNAGGTVNVVPASANLQRHRSEISLRGDTFAGFRTSVDLNRVLKTGKLAARGSAVYQRDGFDRKPSGTDTTRLNGMLKYQPFKSTTFSASYSHYRIFGNRPNTTMPRDTITSWKNAGSPTWNPLTTRLTLNGTPSAVTYNQTTVPSYFINTGSSGRVVSNLAVQADGAVGYWGPAHSATTPNPATGTNAWLVNTNSPIRANQPLFAGDPSVTNRSLYDWTSINLAAINFLRETTETTHLGLEHFFLHRQRHVLALQAGYFKEDSEKYRRDLAGGAASVRAMGALYVDVNEFLPDGRPNPDLLRPFLGIWNQSSNSEPLTRETYRTQVVYKLDLRAEKSRLRWLGMHQLSGYAEHKEQVRRLLTYKDSIVSSHSWLTPGESRANNASGIANNYFRYYVGDKVGQNVDYAPHSHAWGQYNYTFGANGNLTTEPATIGPAVVSNGTASGLNNRRQILKSKGAVWQSFLLDDRLVTTLGLREDRNYNRGGVAAVSLPDGVNIDMNVFNRWAAGDWTYNRGKTKTAGVVAKPTSWLHLHANASNSFQPQVAAVNLFLQPVPDPSGEGRDYGFTLDLFKGRLVARFNQYQTKQVNSRATQSAGLATRLRMIDFEPTSPVALVPMATGWVTRAHPGWTASQINTEVARITQLDEKYLNNQPDSLTETSDVVAKGREIEIFFNPSAFWTTKLNLTQQESIEARTAPGITNWLNLRLPVWNSIIDPEKNIPWFTTHVYDSASPFDRLTAQVTTPLNVAKATEGKSRPQIRKYRANLITSYRLDGLTDNRLLKGFKVGGGVRWEDRGAIGYYGVQQLPASVTQLDASRPIYDKPRSYFDAFISYRTRLFANKVGTTIQLNGRNLQENGRLQPIAAYPDGTANVYRIVDPRQFILSATFDL